VRLIEASKRKDMWMGGNVPLGYDREGQGKLIVNSTEANQGRLIVDLYLELGCVRKFRERLVRLPRRPGSPSTGSSLCAIACTWKCGVWPPTGGGDKTGESLACAIL
jgi:hypothetical protein